MSTIVTPVHLCNSFNALGKEHAEEREEIEAKSIKLQRHKGRKINRKPKFNTNEMNIDKINKVIKTFNDNAKKK